jgi:hypothetical protein
MAGDWIKMEHVTPDKPEVYRMAGMLGISPEHVIGCLVRVWIWADQQSIDGNAVGVTDETLDAVSRRNGFGTAMRQAGWLGGDGATLSFPNFDRHNGNTAKERALTNKRVKRMRNAAGVTNSLPEKRREERTPIVPTPRFDEFWNAYPGPRKVAKTKCLAVWLLHGFEASADQILLHVAAMKATPQWQEANGQFVPAPLTYLNQRRFEDGTPEQPRRRLAL